MIHVNTSNHVALDAPKTKETPVGKHHEIHRNSKWSWKLGALQETQNLQMRDNITKSQKQSMEKVKKENQWRLKLGVLKETQLLQMREIITKFTETINGTWNSGPYILKWALKTTPTLSHFLFQIHDLKKKNHLPSTANYSFAQIFHCLPIYWDGPIKIAQPKSIWTLSSDAATLSSDHIGVRHAHWWPHWNFQISIFCNSYEIGYTNHMLSNNYTIAPNSFKVKIKRKK